MGKTSREDRAAHLLRLEIGELINEYRRVLNLGMGEPPLHPMIREVLVRAILDLEFDEAPEQER